MMKMRLFSVLFLLLALMQGASGDIVLSERGVVGSEMVSVEGDINDSDSPQLPSFQPALDLHPQQSGPITCEWSLRVFKVHCYFAQAPPTR